MIAVRRARAALVAAVLALGCSSEPRSEHGPQERDHHHDESAHAAHGHGKEDGHEEGGDKPHDEGVVELSERAAARTTLRTEPAAERILLSELKTTGHVDFDQDRVAHVSPRLTGRVQGVYAVLGQQVRAGERLAVVESIDLGKAKAEFLQAKAREKLAERTLQRIEKLAADQIVPERDVLAAHSEHEQAHSAFLAARQALQLYGLSRTEVDTISFDDRRAALYAVRSPIGGRVVDKHVTRGELVTPERNLFTIADMTRLWVWIDVYERDISGVHVGDSARVSTDASRGRVFEGKVSYVRDQVDSKTRTIRARVDIHDEQATLRPKQFVSVELVDPHGAEGSDAPPAVVAVPESALQRQGKGSVVFVRQAPRRFEQRPVTTGRRSAGWVEIVSGVSVGDPVVVEGAFLLKSELAKESMGGGHSH